MLALARAHRLSVFDASYLELALREAISLATLDDDLTAAAIAEGTELIGAPRPGASGTKQVDASKTKAKAQPAHQRAKKKHR